MSDEAPMHLCLLAHCVSAPSSGIPLTHPELFIPFECLDELLGQLSDEQFHFCLPGNAVPGVKKTCSFTFDDGYANNMLFLPLAEKYQLPFILFLNSINITEQLPFLWDAASLTGTCGMRMVEDYRSAYACLDQSVIQRLLRDENHRPFTLTELQEFSTNCWVHFALHTHSHQVLVGRFLAQAKMEIEENSRFLSQFPRSLKRDLALPCGLYTPGSANELLKLVDRLYTIDGGGTTQDSPIIHRVSLINPQIGGDLMSQVKKSFSWRAKLRRKIVNFRYAAPFFNRF